MLNIYDFAQKSLWSDFGKFFENSDFVFNNPISIKNIRNSSQHFPPISAVETEEDVRVYVLAPGFKKEDFNLTIQGNVLSLESKREDQLSKMKEDLETSYTCYRNERPWGSFLRTIVLPNIIDPNQVNATYERGILSILIGKKQQVEPQKIQINSF